MGGSVAAAARGRGVVAAPAQPGGGGRYHHPGRRQATAPRRHPALRAALMAARDPQDGVVLINVLVTLALASSVLYAMISLSDLSITRSQRFSDAGQAQALIAAGEASLISALTRDMAEAPQTDNLSEPWAQVAQDPIAIAQGSFSLSIQDAQSRINLNSNAMRGALGAQVLTRVGAALDLPADVAARVVARLAQQQVLDRLGDLTAEAGLTPQEVAQLSDFLTVLPNSTDVNLNTAPPHVIGVLTDNPVQAATLIATRDRNGLLTPQDVVNARLILPPGAGFTSSWFGVTVSVQVGQTVQQSTALIQRATGPGDRPSVAVVARETPFRGRP
ncbi:general secretion pathway protein GspK (plasmid) [Paracoccus liaowanqingii]|uniref:General secretion pathway protein GspK n=2 Tax=Paracoccus liaowanqingii TaxID=2560053 RepID=A0A4Y5SSI6_9RHOB|nr:general secretion pathway protein GspK [Paracoccus liaowanqingii]